MFIYDADKSKRRKVSSNRAGKFLLDSRSRILLFLTRLRKAYTLRELSLFFAVSTSTCENYFNDILDRVHETVVPMLFRLEAPELIDPYIPDDFKSKFPGCYFIVDGVPLPIYQPERFVLNRLTWSVYKSQNIFQSTVGEFHAPFAYFCFI